MTRLRGLLSIVLLSSVLAGCAGQSRKLTYAQVQALNPGASACWVLAEYPSGKVTRRPDGTAQSVQYPVEDPNGRNETLTLEFDPCGVLCRKTYSGRPVRPPAKAKPKPPPPCDPCAPGATGQAAPRAQSRGGPPITSSTPSSTVPSSRQRR